MEKRMKGHTELKQVIKAALFYPGEKGSSLPDLSNWGEESSDNSANKGV